MLSFFLNFTINFLCHFLHKFIAVIFDFPEHNIDILCHSPILAFVGLGLLTFTIVPLIAVIDCGRSDLLAGEVGASVGGVGGRWAAVAEGEVVLMLM